LAPYIESLKTSTIVERGNLKWSGFNWVIDDTTAGTRTVSVVGWKEELDHRVVRQDEEEDLMFSDDDAGYIARKAIQTANEQKDRNGKVRPTHIILPDYWPLSQKRTRSLKRGQKVGQVIDDLASIEAGFDWDVTWDTREFIIYYDTVVEGSTIFGKGQDRPDIFFAYGWGPRNLASAGRQIDPSKMANRIRVESQFQTVVIEDIDSMDETGFMFEDHVSLPGVIDRDALDAYAASDLVYRGRPVVTYNLAPSLTTGRSPVAGEDFDIGDVCRLRAKRGAFDVVAQPIRIFSYTVGWSDDGAETLNSVSILPS
jgi:hypothetical protein